VCLSLDRKGQSRRAKFPKTVCVIGFFVIPTARKVPHRKWRAHGSGAPPRPLAPPSGHGEGRLAARAATLPTTRRSPHAPTRFSSRDLKVPLESRGAREGSREAREREVRGAREGSREAREREVRGAREGSSRRARGKSRGAEGEVEWPRVAFRNPIENCKFPILPPCS